MRRLSLARALGAPLVLLACGPEPVATSELEPVCGTPGPHRLFALEPGERIHPLFGAHRIDDRLYFISGTGESEFLGLDRPATAIVHSTDLCGEDRRRIADDIRVVFTQEQLPGVLLGCRGEVSGDLFVLDPGGMTAPRLLLADGCERATWMAHGLVREDEYAEDVSRLLLYPYPIDPAAPPEPIVLVDDIRRHFQTIVYRDGATSDEVLALDMDANLLQIGIPGGDVSVLQSNVHSFDATADGRYLAWEDRLTRNDDGEQPTGDLTLRERATGTDTVVAVAPHPFLLMRFYKANLQLRPGNGQSGGRAILLPSGDTVEIPAGRDLIFDLASDLWLLRGDDGGLYLLDPLSGTETVVTTDPGDLIMASTERVLLLRSEAGADPAAPQALWSYPLTGSAPQLLAERVMVPGFLADDRVFTLLDLDAEDLGDLVLIDPDTLAEHVIDHLVMPVRPFFGWSNDIVERDTIAYQVLDGERSGVWIAKPRPLDEE